MDITGFKRVVLLEAVFCILNHMNRDYHTHRMSCHVMSCQYALFGLPDLMLLGLTIFHQWVQPISAVTFCSARVSQSVVLDGQDSRDRS